MGCSFVLTCYSIQLHGMEGLENSDPFTHEFAIDVSLNCELRIYGQHRFKNGLIYSKYTLIFYIVVFTPYTNTLL